MQRVEAPWTLHAECYTLLIKLSEIPAGLYDPREEAWNDESNGTFAGGVGTIMIVRYTSTPVGSYDELLFAPGIFTVPQPSAGHPKIPKKALRIARIYVSQRTTTYNGRMNWNIPKHLARFEFSAPVTKRGEAPPEKQTVKVFAPGTEQGDGTAPFFACTFQPWRWVPAIPFNMKYAPMSVRQVQPPIPEPAGFKSAVEAELNSDGKIDPYDISAKNEVAVAPGTDVWRSYDVSGKVARMRGCWAEVLPSISGGEEAGKYFPQGLQPWSVGGWMEEAELIIEKPLEWKL